MEVEGGRWHTPKVDFRQFQEWEAQNNDLLAKAHIQRRYSAADLVAVCHFHGWNGGGGQHRRERGEKCGRDVWSHQSSRTSQIFNPSKWHRKSYVGINTISTMHPKTIRADGQIARHAPAEQLSRSGLGLPDCKIPGSCCEDASCKNLCITSFAFIPAFAQAVLIHNLPWVARAKEKERSLPG